MTDFSIEMAKDRIVDVKTRQYFEEVFRSYSGGNYRSAIVMLWSVVVCDLLFKMQELAVAHGDATAKSILVLVEKKRIVNPKSPEWERLLVNEINKRTQFFDAAEFANLNNLLDLRNLSAHPVLTATEVLYAPSMDTARAQIRQTLDSVLTKPAVMTHRVFDSLVEDLDRTAVLLPDRESLKRYLEAKYFPHLVAHVESAIFRSLWKLAFKATDARSEKAREIIYRTLEIIYSRRPTEINTLISGEQSFYSDLSLEGSAVICLLKFLTEHPRVFGLLSEAARTPIRNFAEDKIDCIAKCFFLSNSIDEHLDHLSTIARDRNEAMSGDAFSFLLENASKAEHTEKIVRLAADIYGRSVNYDNADTRFTSLIRPSLPHMTEADFKYLLAKIEKNSQTYDRGRASQGHKEINEAILKTAGETFDLSAYPNFEASLPKVRKEDDLII